MTVMPANQMSNLTANKVNTKVTSISVGMMLYSEYEMSDCTPRVPRSMSRVIPPVWRSK